jgi:hypothetical protein
MFEYRFRNIVNSIRKLYKLIIAMVLELCACDVRNHLVYFGPGSTVQFGGPVQFFDRKRIRVIERPMTSHHPFSKQNKGAKPGAAKTLAV